MNILIFNWQDIKNPQGGGAEVHMHQIFSRIVKMGHRVTLYCSSFEGAPSHETIDGINVIREGGRFVYNLFVPIRYLTRFRKEQFDIVVDDFNKVPFFTPVFVRKPLYFIVHHLFDRSIFREVALPIALPFYFIEKLGIAVARIFRIPVMVVSQSTKAELLKYRFPERDLDIVYNCVDHDIYKPDARRRSASPLIACFGRLKKYKSVDHVLQAFASVIQNVPDARLLIIGEGEYRSSLENLAVRLQIQESVHFTGFVDEQTKVRLLQEAWFMVTSSSKEGWGLTVIESNACGTPVLASNVPGLRDAIKDDATGILYEYGNIDELARKMIELLTDNALRERLGTNAIDWAKTFDWNIAAQQTLTLLEQRIRVCREQ
ncbi:MAG TPA: glycosyltransferase family 4 protein [Bacteroidota bacterium]|nr:glycosyltransferase family 4 protein [Bacteroidota bacterium]